MLSETPQYRLDFKNTHFEITDNMCHLQELQKVTTIPNRTTVAINKMVMSLVREEWAD